MAGAGRIAPCNSKKRPLKSTCSPVQEHPHAPQRLGRPRAALAGIDPAQLELARIVATHADAEREPARRQQRDRRELSRHDRGMAQGQQVHPGLHRDARVGRQQRGRLDQAVSAVTVGKADVVADGEVIHTRRDRCAARARAAGPTRRSGPARAGRSRPRSGAARGPPRVRSPRRGSRWRSRPPAGRTRARRRDLRRTRG